MLHRRSVAALLLIAASIASPCRSLAESQAARTYQVVFLRRNPARQPLTVEEGDRIQNAHMQNIRDMAARGLLVAAGPFEDEPSAISGVFFFVLPTRDEALKVASADPTVLAHRNTVEVLTWRGPAGIGDEYRRVHEAKPDTPEGMGVHPFVILRRTGKQLDGKLTAARAPRWEKLRAEGKIVAAGPVEGDASATDIVIFDRIPDAQAASLAAADPAVSRGQLTPELHRWWSSAHVFPASH